MMITAHLLTDLVRRFILFDDETIVWVKHYPDGPALAVETTAQILSVEVVRNWLWVEKAPWVEAVVVASRQDQVVEGPPLKDVFLVQTDGTPIDLADRQAVAALGMRLHRGDLEMAWYADLLVQCQWPGGWSARVVTDPDAWRADYPAQAKLPPVEAMRTSQDDGALRARFFASREHTVVVGGRSVLDVAAWSVRAPENQPATWQLRPVAEAVPLLPPW